MLRAFGGVGVLAVAGCLGDDGDAATDAPPVTTTDPPGASPATTSDSTGASTPTPTDTSSPTMTDDTDTPDAELDLREANVTAVDVERTDDGYRFDVTLYHDDDGETGYANWWQVETLDGQRLGRRRLLHAHGTREFTRSTDVPVPDGITYVVVRGHDQVHGYGGQAMVLNLETGATEPVAQGPELQDLSDYEPNI
jgi:hypothetical protein